MGNYLFSSLIFQNFKLFRLLCFLQLLNSNSIKMTMLSVMAYYVYLDKFITPCCNVIRSQYFSAPHAKPITHSVYKPALLRTDITVEV